MPSKFLYSLTFVLMISGCARKHDPHSSQIINQNQQNNICQTRIQQKLKVLKKEDQDRKRFAEAQKSKLHRAIRDKQKRLNSRSYQHQTQLERLQHQASLEKLRTQLKREEQRFQQESERLHQEKLLFLKRQQEQRDLEQALKNSLKTKAQEDTRRQQQEMQQQLREQVSVTLQESIAAEPSEGKLVEAGTKIMMLQNRIKATEGRNASRKELSTHLQKDMNISADEANSILDALDIEK